jgi:hypothetical protein
LQAFFRTITFDHDSITGNRLSPDKESFFDLAAAFIYHCIQCYDGFDSSSIFVAWLAYILKQAADGLLDPEILAPFLGSPDSKFAIEWPGEIELLKRGERHCTAFTSTILRTKHHSLFLTKSDYMGLGPPGTNNGDLICILLGCHVPLVLRRVRGYYLVVGECFIYGLMDGEAMQDFEDGRVSLQEFEILLSSSTNLFRNFRSRHSSLPRQPLTPPHLVYSASDNAYPARMSYIQL